MVHRPAWFRDDSVFVSYAPTCGINKDGEDLYLVDRYGQRSSSLDDKLYLDVATMLAGGATETVQWVMTDELTRGYAVPAYWDDRAITKFRITMDEKWPDFKSATLGQLIDERRIEIRYGHGSPSADMRSGSVPYIKVSDLRAGQVNINPTNRVSIEVAERYWRSSHSGLQPFDLLTPLRTSKNIGDFAVLMPGQEQVVLTKEILVVRAGATSDIDPFYLLWALSLRVVREQWRRITFMQTNREDVGQRFREIMIPIAPTPRERMDLGDPFRAYYEGTSELRSSFISFLSQDDDHHVFLASSASDLIHDDGREEDATTGE